MPNLVLGPLLRYVGTTTATVWVETDAACEVQVLGARKPTFHVEGHHYALVLVEGLTPGSSVEYDVRLDGEGVWPLDDGRPPSRIVTREGGRRARLVFGSCRAGAPHHEPYTLDASEDPRGYGVDALWSYSRLLQAGHEPWPDCLLLLGDQVYADEVPPRTAEHIAGRIDARAQADGADAPPDGEVANFEEYTRLHRESWSDPDIRWLLATVPSTMICDDHDVHDDWNISDRWVEEMRRLPWWHERIVGAFMAYWVYQHLGNLSPPVLATDSLVDEVYQHADAGPRLRRFAEAADRTTTSSRFAFSRDFGRTRLVVVDTRAARVLTPGKRDIVDAGEWAWIREQTDGDFDHLILASTLPVFNGAGVHHLEAWNERVCDGAWGRIAARLGERMRRSFEIDHWPAFQRSFAASVDLLRDRSSSHRGDEAPATILVLGGDVHTAYVARVTVGKEQRSGIYQLVCSPFRKPMEPRERRVVQALFSRPAALITRAMAKAAGAPAPRAEWDIVSGPTFANSIGVLELDEDRARVAIRQAGRHDDPAPRLAPLQACDLAPPSPLP